MGVVMVRSTEIRNLINKEEIKHTLVTSDQTKESRTVVHGPWVCVVIVHSTEIRNLRCGIVNHRRPSGAGKLVLSSLLPAAVSHSLDTCLVSLSLALSLRDLRPSSLHSLVFCQRACNGVACVVPLDFRWSVIFSVAFFGVQAPNVSGMYDNSRSHLFLLLH